MKYAYLVGTAAILGLLSSPALAQGLGQTPGASGNPGGAGMAYNPQLQGAVGRVRGGIDSPDKKEMALEHGREMLRDIKKQLANAKTEDERKDLLEQKRAVENAMIDAQQRY